MPSPIHQLLAWGLPRLRGSGDLDDVASERARLEAWHRGLGTTGRLPTRLVPFFDRRYEVATHTLGPAGEGGAAFEVHTIRPRSHRPATTLYYVHGGGFVAPTDAWHVRYALRLARHLDAEVVIPDYPLTPEHDWRGGYEAMLADLATRTTVRPRVVLAGDSAGGGIALALAQGLRDLARDAAQRPDAAPVRQPSHLLLLAPWGDLTTSTPETYELDAYDPWLFIGKLDAYAGWWAGRPEDLARPEVSPALGDLADLPPTLMFCGTRDLLLPGCRLLARRGAEAGWDLTYIEQPGLLHVYPLLPVPEARPAWRRTREFLGPRAVRPRAGRSRA